jgi:hypothetical protein
MAGNIQEKAATSVTTPHLVKEGPGNEREKNLNRLLICQFRLSTFPWMIRVFFRGSIRRC